MSTPFGSAAGWYPDPQALDEQRYWNGRQWTDALAPLLEAPIASPVDYTATIDLTATDHDAIPRGVEP